MTGVGGAAYFDERQENDMKWHKRYSILACIFFVLCMYTGYKHI